jgi:hypothetical protein
VEENLVALVSTETPITVRVKTEKRTIYSANGWHERSRFDAKEGLCTCAQPVREPTGNASAATFSAAIAATAARILKGIIARAAAGEESESPQISASFRIAASVHQIGKPECRVEQHGQRKPIAAIDSTRGTRLLVQAAGIDERERIVGDVDVAVPGLGVGGIDGGEASGGRERSSSLDSDLAYERRRRRWWERCRKRCLQTWCR